MFNIKSKTLRMVVFSQLSILLLFMAMTVCNEFFDLPNLLFGDQPVSAQERRGEIIIEFIILAIIIVIQVFVIKKFYKRIRILEGFIPICANCKKIRHEQNWNQIEQYISEHSLVTFTHSICPDCMKELYPELCDDETK